MSTDFRLSHARVGEPTAGRVALVLHGIFGSGANFRSFAKRLAAARPDWAFELVDLRLHGQSQGAPPPQTIASAAEDLARLSLDLPVRAIFGHSFGGKVALEYVARFGRELEHAFILDSNPGSRSATALDGEVGGVLQALRSVDELLPAREDFHRRLAARGLSKPIVDWLAMNLRHAEGGFRLRLDLDGIEALLADYHARDLWSVFETTTTTRMHAVIGGRSAAYSASDRARLERAIGSDLVVLEKAGHWLHVDDPDGLLEATLAALS